MNCEICGNEDLYSSVSGERVCSICKIKFVGGLTARREDISNVRDKLGLKQGEFFKQDCGAEAKKILGR